MAFNINAQVVLSGPKNLNQITRKIQSGFGKVSNASLNLNIDPKNIKTLDALNRRVVVLTNNFTKLNTAINATGSSLNKINTTSTAVNNLTRSQNNLNKQANNVTQSIQQQNTALGSLTKRLSSVAKTAIAFGLISRPIYDLQRAFTGAVTDAISFEKEIVKISQVTGQTVEQLAGLKDTIDTLATTLGSNANELAETARIITQTGKTAEETRIILTALARSTLAPTFGNITDTTEGLIAALGQFNLNAKDSEAILGSLNKVSKNFAVESEDLISAIRRTGGVFAQAAGESKGTIGALQELSAIFTAVRSTTRESADTIAAGLRTIFSRIQRRGTIEFLEQFNIQLTDAQGKFVGIFPAFDQLSTRLDTLIKQGDALTLSAIAEELGGIRQIGKLLPAIAQFDKARQALQDAQQGAVEGLGVDVAKGLDTLDNRIRRVQESFNELIRTVFDSNAFQDFAKGILSSSEAILKAGTQIVETLEPIFPLLTSIGAIKLGKGIGGLIGGGAIGGAISTVTGQASANASQAAAQAAQQSAAATQNNTQAVSQINTTLSRVSNQLANIFRSLEASFIQNTRQIANIFSSVEGNFNRLSIQMGNLIQALGGFGTQINAASAKIVGFAGAAISKPSNRVVGFAGARTTRATGGEIPKFKDGGWVKGPSHAAGGVIAELEGGEYVIPKQYAQGTLNRGVSDVSKIRKNRAYVFDFDDTLAISNTTAQEFFSEEPDISASRQNKIRNARITSLADSARKRSAQGYDVHVLTARQETPGDKAALQEFLVKAGIKAGRTIFTGGLFEGETEPGKRPGTTRKISTATKKARILAELSKDYDSILFLDDAIENVLKAKEISNVKAIGVDKKTQSLQRVASGGTIKEIKQRFPSVPKQIQQFEQDNKRLNTIQNTDLVSVNIKKVPITAKQINRAAKNTGPSLLFKKSIIEGTKPSGKYKGNRGLLFEDVVSQIKKKPKLSLSDPNAPLDFIAGDAKFKKQSDVKDIELIGKVFRDSLGYEAGATGRNKSKLKRYTKITPESQNFGNVNLYLPAVDSRFVRPDSTTFRKELSSKKFGGIIQSFALGDIVKQSSVGAAILDPDEQNDSSVIINVKNIESRLGYPTDTKSGFSGLGSVFKARSYKIDRQGLNKNTSDRFNNALNNGLVNAINSAASEVGQDLGVGPAIIDKSSINNFINSQRAALRGDLFEATLLSLNNRGVFDNSLDPSRPFDFPDGLRPPLKDNFDRLPEKFIDAKSSFTAASDSSMKTKITDTLSQFYKTQGFGYKDIIARKEREQKNKSNTRLNPKEQEEFNQLSQLEREGKLKTSKAVRLSTLRKRSQGKALGGIIQSFAGGGVPVRISNGEAIVPAQSAKGRYNELKTMNKTGEGNLSTFSGTSIAKGPGSGTSDSIFTSLNPGDFVIKERSTKKIQSKASGGVIQKFAAGNQIQDARLSTLSPGDLKIIEELKKAEKVAKANTAAEEKQTKTKNENIKVQQASNAEQNKIPRSAGETIGALTGLLFASQSLSASFTDGEIGLFDLVNAATTASFALQSLGGIQGLKDLNKSLGGGKNIVKSIGNLLGKIPGVKSNAGSNLAQLPKGAGIAGRVAAFGGPRAAALATGTAGIGAGLLGGTVGNLLGGKISDVLIGNKEQTLAGFRGSEDFGGTAEFRGSLTGGFTGAGAGAGLGAAIGTLIAPGIGTAIGAAIGGGAGSIVGSIVGSINKPLEQASFSIAKSIESSGKRLTESLDKISNSVLNAESISNISSILNVNALSFANGVQDIITNEADKISFENLGSLITDNLGKVLLSITPANTTFVSDQLFGTDFVSSFENSAQQYLQGFDETWGTAIAASNRSKKIIAKQLANLKDLIKEEDIQRAQEQYARSIAQFFSSEGTNLFSGVDISTDDGAKQFNDTLLLMSKNGNDYAQSLIEFENALVKQQLTFRSVQLAQTGTQQDTTTAAAINTVLSSGININNISELQTFLTDQGFDPGDVTIFLNELGKARNALNEFEETAKKQVGLNNLLKESASIIKSYNLAVLNSTRGLSQSLSDASDSFNIFAARVNNIKLNSGEITTRDIGSRSLENQISLIENISGGNLQEFRQVNQIVDILPIAIEEALNKLTAEDFGPNASAQTTRDVITDSISQLTNLVPGEAISQALFANLRSLVSSRQTAGASPTIQVPKKLNELLNAGDIDSLLKDVVGPLQESFEEQKKGAEILRKDFENRVNYEIQRLRDIRNFEAEILQRRLNNEDVIANILDRTQNTVLKSLTTLERQVSTAGGGNSDINTLLQRRGFAQQRQQQLQSQVDLGDISERTGSELIFMGSVIEETSKALEKFANDTSVAAAAQQEAAKIRERTDSSERGIDGLINAFSSGNRETVQAVLQQQQALRNVTLGLGTFQEALLVFKNIDDPIISALNRSRFGEEGAREFERTLRTQLAEQFKGTPVEGIANELLNSIDNDNANLVRLATDANVFAQKQLEVLRIIEQQNNVAINNAAGGAGVNNFDQSVNKFAAAIDRFTKATGQAQFTTQLQAINDNRKRLGLPPIIFAKGGPVYRSSGGPSDMSQFARGTDTVPAMLTPGEYVINKKAVDKYGSKTLSDINDGKAELYSASGGLVYLRKGGTFNFGSKKYKFERDRNGIIGDNTMVGQGIDQFDEYMGLFGSIISNTTIGGIQDELSKNTFNFGSKKYRMERDRNGIIGDDTMVGKTIDLYKNTKIKDLINPRAIPEGINKIVEDINTPITVKKYDGLYDPKRLTNNDYVEPKYLESKPTEKQTIDSYRSIKDQISKIINSVKKENRSLNSFERSAYDEYLNLYSRFKDKQLLQDTLIPLPKISSSDSADAAVKKYNENAAKQPGVVGDDYFAKFAAPSTGINYNQGLYNNPIGFNNGGIVPDYKRFGGIMYANVRKYDQQILNYISTFTSKARQRKLLNEYLDLQNRFNRIVIPGIQYHEQQIIRGNPGYDIQKNRFFVNAKNLMASKLPKLINLFPPKRIVKDRFAGAITITQKDIQDNIEDQVIESSKINAIDKFSFFQTGGKVRYTKEAKALQNGGQSLGINFKKRGTDTVPAMLTPGEFVIKKESVQKYGTGLMNDLNKGKAPMFAANGGPVYKQTGGFIGVTQTQKPQQANMILNSDRAAKMLQQSIIDGGSKVTAQWQQLFDGITQKLNQALVPISTIPEVINAQVAPIEIQGVNSFVEAIADNIIPKIQDHMQKLIGSTMNQKLQQGDGTF